MKYPLILLFTLLCSLAQAQRIDQLNTEQFKTLLAVEHPRIGINKDLLSGLAPLELKVPAFEKEKAHLLDMANRLVFQKNIKTSERDLLTLLLAFRLTGKSEYLMQTAPALTNALSNRDVKVENAESYMETALFVTLYYDWAYHYIDSLNKVRIENYIVHRAFAAGDSSFKRQASWMRSGSKENLKYNVSLILAGIAVGDKHPEIATLNINRGVYNLKWALGAYENKPEWHTDTTRGCENFFYWGLLLHTMDRSLGTTLGLYRYPFWKNETLIMGINANSKGYYANLPNNEYLAWKIYMGKEVGMPNWSRPYFCDHSTQVCKDKDRTYLSWPINSAYRFLDRWLSLELDDRFLNQNKDFAGQVIITNTGKATPTNGSKAIAKPSLKKVKGKKK
jgi:hypothetical protein